MSDVLVDKEDLLLAARDDEGLLELADDGPEAPRTIRRDGLLEESALGRRVRSGHRLLLERARDRNGGVRGPFLGPRS